jgi:hypothetical protein
MSDIMFSVEEVLAFEILGNGILWASGVVGCRKVRFGAERLIVSLLHLSLGLSVCVCVCVRIFQT